MRPGPLWKSVLVLLILALPMALAQTRKPSSNPSEGTLKYDTATEVTLKVTVEEVNEVPNPKGEVATRLVVKNAGETIEIRLCPHSVLKEFDVAFAKGD